MEAIHTHIQRDWKSIEARFDERKAIVVEFGTDPLRLAAEVAKLRAEVKDLSALCAVAGLALQHSKPINS